ncbi:MFS transporter [Variovorax sp. dw_308]|uniref:MFS transporter n=1 Tax=Variovorax sp. dw_308 TaxID=2721546 RepID=UPI001C43D202|nr:MFS transporter [Variovorax sp. dw_308]
MTPAAASRPQAPPLLGLGAVLLGAFVSTLNGRLSTFGLADIRGAMGLGFDDAAWLTTAQTAAQMMVAPLAVWAATVFGPRRVLLAGCVVFATASALAPFSRGIAPLLALQFIGGLGSGCFMPLTIMFVLRNLPPRYWALGIALYALNIEASLNIAASVEGFYVDRLSWQWIFWQNLPLAVAMAFCVHFGMPREPVDRKAARDADWFGMASASLGFGLLYAALDQGNRLDWLASGLVVALLVGGSSLVVAFFVHESITPQPWIDVRLLTRGYLPILLLLVIEVRFASLGTGFLVPQFLTAVRGFRPPEVGAVLLWLALPQLVAVPLAVLLLRHVDPRWVAFTGIAMIGSACAITSNGLTASWSSADFLPTQLLQALGQTCAISAAIFIGVLNLKPPDIPTFSVMIQIARLFGAEVGFAFAVTFVRTSEQLASHVFGNHVQAGAVGTLARLQGIGAGLGVAPQGAGAALARSTALLAQAVRTQANLQACIEGFGLIAASTALAFWLLLALDAPPKGPASPHVLRWRGGGT